MALTFPAPGGSCFVLLPEQGDSDVLGSVDTKNKKPRLGFRFLQMDKCCSKDLSFARPTENENICFGEYLANFTEPEAQARARQWGWGGGGGYMGRGEDAPGIPIYQFIPIRYHYTSKLSNL